VVVPHARGAIRQMECAADRRVKRPLLAALFSYIRRRALRRRAAATTAASDDEGGAAASDSNPDSVRFIPAVMAGRRRRRRTAEEEKSWAAAEAEDFAQASAAAPGFILCYPPPADSPDACRLSALYEALLADSARLRSGDGEGGSSDSDLDVGPDPLGDMRAAAAAAAAAVFAPGDSDSDDARPAKGHGGPVLGAGAGSGGGGGAGDVVDRAAAWAVRWIGPLLAVGCLFPPLLLALRLLFGRRARRGRRGGAAGDDWVGHEAAAWAGVCGRILLWFQVRARAQCTRALHTHARPALPTNERAFGSSRCCWCCWRASAPPRPSSTPSRPSCARAAESLSPRPPGQSLHSPAAAATGRAAAGLSRGAGVRRPTVEVAAKDCGRAGSGGKAGGVASCCGWWDQYTNAGLVAVMTILL
jgi:hypothetical protein